MSADPETSILIPTWNREAFIGPAIESALAQTRSDLEVVVVDNASSDGTWEVLEQWMQRDPRVRAFRNTENVGPVRNWRRAAEEARGRFCKMLFSDDLIQPRFLERTLPVLDDPEVGFVWTAVEGLDEQGSVVTHLYDEGGGDYSGRGFCRVVLGVDSGPLLPVSPGCAVFRTADFRSALQLEIENRIGSDFLMHGIGNDQHVFLDVALRYDRVVHLPDRLARFRHHGGSITASNDWARCELMYRISQAVFIDQAGEGLLSDDELARFNAQSELLVVGCRGDRFGLRSWRDFHHPEQPVRELFDRTHLVSNLPGALQRASVQEVEEETPLSAETFSAIVERLEKERDRVGRLREELDLSKERVELLKERIRSLTGGWTRLGWRLMPWSRPSWRNSPFKPVGKG